MNTRAAILRAAAAAGLEVETLRLLEKDPWYGRSTRPLFLAFMLYERVVNRYEALAGLRANLFGVLRREVSPRP